MEQPLHNLRATAKANRTPAQRVASVAIVALIHLGMIVAITLGLANRLMDKLPEPIVADIAEQEQPKDIPPPPPPEQVKPPPPPTVPPPDITIAADIAPPSNNTITAVKPTAVVAKDPMEGVTAAATTRKANCGNDFYPALSQRMHEEGTTVLKGFIGTDGIPKDIAVATSSGKPRLDEAAVACVKTWRYKPAMKEGAPIEIPMNPQVVWKLQ